MAKVIAYLAVIWIIAIGIVLGMVVTSPMTDQLIDESIAGMTASANMSQLPGIQQAVQSFPVWRYSLPIVLGLVVSGYILYKNREELRLR